MASSSFRKFSACWACLVTKSSLLSLVRPDLRAERPVDVVAGDLGVFDRVVQHGRDDRGVVELELGQDRRDFEGMGEVGIARGALLRAMRLHRKDVGAIEQVFIGVGIIAADPFHQFVLPHHRRNDSACLLCRIPIRRPARSECDDSAWLQQCGQATSPAWARLAARSTCAGSTSIIDRPPPVRKRKIVGAAATRA